MKKLFSTLLALTMVLALAACGSKPSQQPASSVSEAPGSSAPAEERAYWLKGADEVTGTINVYTTMEETQQETLRTLWQQYYPNCKIEFQSDSVGTLITRLQSESNAPVADVLIGGLFEADGSKYHEVLQPYTAVNDAEQNYHDPAGYYTLYDVQVMCLITNEDILKELGIEVNGYKDLLQPELKGKIIMADPSASSSAYRQLQTILATMGDQFDDDKGWDYIKELMIQANGIITTSSSQVYNDVINGEYAVGLSYESTVQAMIADGATNVECIYMEEGNTAMAGGAAIVKGAPNKVAAEAMMNLLASNIFQDARSQQSGGRGTNSLCADSGLPADSTLGLVPLDFDYLAKSKSQLMDRWATLWASVN